MRPPRARRRPVEPDYDHPLLTPLVRAQDAVARLEASAEMASDAVAETKGWSFQIEQKGYCY